MGRHGNRQGQCFFSTCPFTGRRPLTTSSTGILIPSPPNLSSIHSFKAQDTTSCLDYQRKKSLRHPHPLPKINWPCLGLRVISDNYALSQR